MSDTVGEIALQVQAAGVVNYVMPDGRVMQFRYMGAVKLHDDGTWTDVS